MKLILLSVAVVGVLSSVAAASSYEDVKNSCKKIVDGINGLSKTVDADKDESFAGAIGIATGANALDDSVRLRA